MDKRIDGKVCVITGAARGIGAATARLFARAGARLVLADIRDESGQALAAEICNEGSSACSVHADGARFVGARTLIDVAVSTFGTIHVLSNSAGTAVQGMVGILSEEDWDKTFAVNVKSMFLCSKYAMPVMRSAGGGVIINQASESGLIGFPMHPTYCASKAAVVNLTRSMAIGHAQDKIRMNPNT